MYRRLTLIVCAILICSTAFAQNVSYVTVWTQADNNRNASVWYRVPEHYREIPGRKWRVLVIFGGRNCGGSNEVSNALGWAKWADRNGVFLVAPGFRDDRYWEPQAWSGRALLSALEQIGRNYEPPVDMVGGRKARGRESVWGWLGEFRGVGVLLHA